VASTVTQSLKIIQINYTCEQVMSEFLLIFHVTAFVLCRFWDVQMVCSWNLESGTGSHSRSLKWHHFINCTQLPIRLPLRLWPSFPK